ncbi:heparinase II/III family protein [Bradyrhizobium guangzhouense]|uniref:heparinase II/III family protein n=1 Tax=Bradyrhizobium guangzhouense TaxID=1325095 RepID=UPI0013E8D248|nr:alginate lyase family protein [Bradyrhizobium guangzhouense]
MWSEVDTFTFDVPTKMSGAGDVKLSLELNRLQFLIPISVAAKVGETELQGRLFTILENWMTCNPPFKGLSWLSGIECASRIVSMLTILSFCDKLSEQQARRVRQFLHAHAYWIHRYPSLYSSSNNHLVAEIGALYLLSVCVPDLPSAEQYREAARTGLEREILRQFHVDGIGAEQSPGYAAYSLEWFALVALEADLRRHPFSQSYLDRIRQAVEAFCWFMDDAGHVPRIGDEDEGRVLSFGNETQADYIVSVVDMARRLLKMPSLPFERSEPTLRDGVLFSAGDKLTNYQSPSGRRSFSKGGYTVNRQVTDLGTLLFVFDHGPLGFLSIAAHGHADALAVWLHWGDEQFLVDGGTYTYNSDTNFRNKFRGTLAHNTLAIADEDQSLIAGPFNWTNHAQAHVVKAETDFVEAEHDGYQSRFGAVHRRRVAWMHGGVQLTDTVTFASSSIPPWRSCFTVGEGVNVKVDWDVAELRSKGGRVVRLRARIDNDPCAWRLVPCEVSPSFGKLTNASRLELGMDADRQSPVKIDVFMDFILVA